MQNSITDNRGGKKHLFFLHGLFDCSTSWKPIAENFSDEYITHTLNLRNHRDGKFSSTMSIDEMVDDIKTYAEQNNIEKFSIVGHSLGGKTAMAFTHRYPQMIDRLIIVDITPCKGSSLKEYNAVVEDLMNTLIIMKNLPLDDFHSLKDFMTGIAQYDIEIQRIIIGNILFQEGKFSWAMNLDAVFRNFANLTSGFELDDFDTDKITVPTLFIKALNSAFLPSSDFKAIKYIFSDSQIIEIPDCTHKIHFEKPAELTDAIRKFLSI